MIHGIQSTQTHLVRLLTDNNVRIPKWRFVYKHMYGKPMVSLMTRSKWNKECTLYLVDTFLDTQISRTSKMTFKGPDLFSKTAWKIREKFKDFQGAVGTCNSRSSNLQWVCHDGDIHTESNCHCWRNKLRRWTWHNVAVNKCHLLHIIINSFHIWSMMACWPYILRVLMQHS